jgi:hypothetical protein
MYTILCGFTVQQEAVEVVMVVTGGARALL